MTEPTAEHMKAAQESVGDDELVDVVLAAASKEFDSWPEWKRTEAETEEHMKDAQEWLRQFGEMWEAEERACGVAEFPGAETSRQFLALAALYREAVEALQAMLDDCNTGAYSDRNARHARRVLAKAHEVLK